MTRDDCLFMEKWLQMEGTFTCCSCKKRIKEMMWDVQDPMVQEHGSKLFPDCTLCDHYINKYDLRNKLNNE